ncbi:MAG: hypothetical protein ACRD50_02850 [Candidatus Acidiferrales bacterium]
MESPYKNVLVGTICQFRTGSMAFTPDDLQAKSAIVRGLQTETAAELDTLMPFILSRAFRGDL